MNDIVVQAIREGLEQQIKGVFQASHAVLSDFKGKIKITKKVNLLVKLRLLQDLTLALCDGNHEKYFSDVKDINSKISERYDEILEMMYDKPLVDYYGSFNGLWERIKLANNRVLKSDYEPFAQCKLTAYCTWRTLCQFYENEHPYNAYEYFFEYDDSDTGFIEPRCRNRRLTTLQYTLQNGNSSWVPLNWKNLTIPVDFLINLNDPPLDNSKGPIAPVRWIKENATLNTLYNEAEALSTIKLDNISEIISSNWIRIEIAEALANLSWIMLRFLSFPTQLNAFSYKPPFDSEAVEHVLSDPLVIETADDIDTLTMKKTPENNIIEPQVKLDLWEELALKRRLMIEAPDISGVYINKVKSTKNFQRGLQEELITYWMREGKLSREKAIDEMWAYFPKDADMIAKVRKPNGKEYSKNSFASSREYPIP